MQQGPQRIEFNNQTYCVDSRKAWNFPELPSNQLKVSPVQRIPCKQKGLERYVRETISKLAAAYLCHGTRCDSFVQLLMVHAVFHYCVQVLFYFIAHI